eukprot:CAMPEP_0174334400 /NCGR_PEP_ID=MMETSP0810-20121108/19896_1 /TAXON_ID=73025 ORGANISM="Eutreptiella gymnastica-like, Strain CCMP1594" /NCGR_SAMPLE_ID=MMETSP0810 /ASSEMBLY_ACC=CAM_ASM_000659 /LENGTH=99 /DNA_ID=CAMNT_0015452043 /DNA_START=82 /DNA_END=378 /DNA_ORIENTATION=-
MDAGCVAEVMDALTAGCVAELKDALTAGCVAELCDTLVRKGLVPMPCSAVVVLKDVFTPVVVLLMPGFRPVAVQDGGLDAAGSGAAGRPSRGPRAVGSG